MQMHVAVDAPLNGLRASCRCPVASKSVDQTAGLRRLINQSEDEANCSLVHAKVFAGSAKTQQSSKQHQQTLGKKDG